MADAKKKLRGFATLSPKALHELTSRAGTKAHQLHAAHTWNSREAVAAGSKGGKARCERRAFKAKEACSCIRCRQFMFFNKNWKYICLNKCWPD